MDSGFYSAFTGLAARMQSLDLVANNLANVNTAGYKAQKEFYRAFTASLNNRSLTPVNQAINDFGMMGGSRIDSPPARSTPPAMTPTGASTVPAFSPSRPRRDERYTRNGNFSLNTQRQLVDSQGNLVQGEDGPIKSFRQTHHQHRRNSFRGRRDRSTTESCGFRARNTARTRREHGLCRPRRHAKPASASRKFARACWKLPTAIRCTSAIALINLQRNAEMMQRALSIFNTDFNQTAVQELPHV